MVRTKVKSYGESNLGRVRRNNEDAFHIDADRGIFLVVDGIGGQAAGEKAAEIAVECVRNRLERQIGTTEQRVREAIANANREILQQARAHAEWRGMACVLTVAVLDNGEAVVGHVGDSRLYQIRQGKIRKVTHDHSPVGQREESGELTEAEAMRHPRRNEVFRDVGSEEHTPDDEDFIELQRIPFEADSALLLCSDGLSDLVPSAEIQALVERHAGDPAPAVRDLIAAANRAGGKDNVTVVLVEGEQFSAPPAATAGPAGAVTAGSARSRSIFAGRPAWFLYGLLLAAGAAWFSRSLWIPKPVMILPRVLAVGQGAKYSTIAAAMADARVGDTVEVQVGDYPEQVPLKTGVTVRSQVPREAVLRGLPASAGPAVVAEGVKDARIAGFQIVGDPHQPLSPAVLLENAAVEVEDLDISGAGVGIEIRGGAPLVVGNSVRDCTAQGILITNNAAPWVSHNSVQRCKVAGLVVRPGSKPILVDNVFEKNVIELPPDVPVNRDFLIDIPKARPFAPAARPREEIPQGKKK
ncbi:MAG TPA: protein phosphatase 2C domain-containing protein [Bryobacteraceae bacterium]|nr:protein phosphatase 2C domain-containing protein [Bryobacteraceae bacterium]